MKTYEIQVLDDHSNIIHKHYYQANSKDDAYQNAMASKKHHNGADWAVIEIEGSLVKHMEEHDTPKGIKLYRKLWACMEKAIGNKAKYGCHLNEIARHLGRSIESNETYYDTLIDVWCDYFLKD